MWAAFFPHPTSNLRIRYATMARTILSVCHQLDSVYPHPVILNEVKDLQFAGAPYRSGCPKQNLA
jgi:hypothetical protein